MEKRIEVEELKRIQIEILNVVSDFCDKNGIKYWIDSGTLLGAIRHKGYIPWDDDIDVGMLREDYDKFLKLFNESNNRYKAYSIENNKKFYYPFCKVLDTNTVLYEPNKNGIKLAVNIDIFPYDRVPYDKALIKHMFDVRDFNRKCFTIKSERFSEKKSFIEKVILFFRKMILLPFSKSFFVMNIVKNSKSHKDDLNASYVGSFVVFSKVYCEVNVFDSFEEKEFEGNFYKVPIGYDKWLRTFYGDYMKLPPKAERVTHHTFEAYHKD